MRVALQGVRLYVDVEGAELVPEGQAMRQRPTVVALHGGPGADHSTLKPGLSPLAADCQLVYLDLRGHGRSDAGPPDQWTIARLADDVAGLCDALGINRPVVYGQSFGAIVALTYASRHPEHPRGLMLVGATALGYGLTLDRVVEAFRRLGGDKAAEVCRRDAESPSPRTHDEWMRYCFPYLTKQRSQQEMEEFRRRIVQRPYAIHERLNAEMKTMDLRAELGRIACPTLLLVGEEDPETPPEAADQIASGIGPDIARVVRIRDAAHTVLLDQPAAAHEAMRKFLAELEPEQQEYGPLLG
jgi:proline iminopeptidase